MLINNLSEITELSDYYDQIYVYEPTYVELEMHYDYHEKLYTYEGVI